MFRMVTGGGGGYSGGYQGGNSGQAGYTAQPAFGGGGFAGYPQQGKRRFCLVR